MTADFFEAVEEQLPAERGTNGEPHAHDFLAVDLLAIVERFETALNQLPELIPGRSNYRQLIGSGRMVYGYVAVGQLAADGAVELVGIQLDAW